MKIESPELVSVWPGEICPSWVALLFPSSKNGPECWSVAGSQPLSPEIVTQELY